MGLPTPVVRGKGKVVSTAQDILEQLAGTHEAPRLVLEYRHLAKLKSTYIDSLPLQADTESRVHTTFQAAATATGRKYSSVNPNLQNIPIRTELGRRDSRSLHSGARECELLVTLIIRRLELRLCWRISARIHFTATRLREQ